MEIILTIITAKQPVYSLNIDVCFSQETNRFSELGNCLLTVIELGGDGTLILYDVLCFIVFEEILPDVVLHLVTIKLMPIDFFLNIIGYLLDMILVVPLMIASSLSC